MYSSMKNPLRTAFPLLLVFILQLAAGTAPAQVFVDASATGANNGTSWANAFTNLQSALAGPGVEIWVADGTYKPVIGTNRGIPFQISSGKRLYGGFAGTETSLSQRNIAANPTILSGEIGLPGPGDNSYNVIVADNASATTILDGFIVRDGDANLSGGGLTALANCDISIANVSFISNLAAQSGGGLYIGSGSPTLTNVTFSQNSAAFGGGMRCNGNPTLTNVLFALNTATSSGGGLYNSGNPILKNVVFDQNSSTSSGGGMQSSGSAQLFNVVFTRNSATSSAGGGWYSTSGSPVITNVSFGNNSAGVGGGAFLVNSSSVWLNSILWGNTPNSVIFASGSHTISYSIVEGGLPVGAVDGGNNRFVNPLFVDPTNGNLRLQELSPAINVGNSAAPGLPTTDVDGNPRISSWAVDLGAYEYPFGCEPFIVSALDIGNDQGRQLRLRIAASSYDALGSPNPILQYESYRRIDALPAKSSGAGAPGVARPVQGQMISEPSILDAGWEFVGAVPAHGMAEYNMVVPTLADSTISNGMHWSMFFIRAATANPLVFCDSRPDSGYSLDNLAPVVPLFTASYVVTGFQLEWVPSPDADLQYYKVYRGTSPDFEVVVGVTAPVHATIDTQWLDTEPTRQVYYKLSAVDFSGNESEPRSAGVATNIDDRLPRRFALHQNVPNPFNPRTVIHYEVPVSAGHVTVQVLDVSGRLVRTLLEGPEAPGRKSLVWDGLDNGGRRVPAGIYLYRLTGSDFRETRKMALIK